MKTKNYSNLFLLIFIFISITVFSQPAIQWEKSFGGNNNEYFQVMQQTIDGGCVIGGHTASNDGNVTGLHQGMGNLYVDIWIVKIDINGNIQWQKALGGTDSDDIRYIKQTTDGGYIVVGTTYSVDGDVVGFHGNGEGEYWVVKLDGNGNIIWKKTLGGTEGDVTRNAMQTSDNGYIICGNTLSSDGDVTGYFGSFNLYFDYWIVKLDGNGNIQWENSLGGGDAEYCKIVQQTSDGGYIVGGESRSNNGEVTGHHGQVGVPDYWIVKLDGSGNIQWQKSIGGSRSEELTTLMQTSDGGYIAGGTSYSNDGDVVGHHGTTSSLDYWIVKLDGNGTIQWQKSLGGMNMEYFRNIQQTFDGGYIIAGTSNSNDGDVIGHHGNTSTYDYWVVKIDVSGNIQWQKSLGGSDNDNLNVILMTSDGGYLLGGSSVSNDGDVIGHHGSTNTSDYWIIKLDGNANIQWQKSMGGSSSEGLISIQSTPDGGFIIGGDAKSNDGDVGGHFGSMAYTDYWIVKLNSPTSIEDNSSTNHIAIFPNPTIGLFNLNFNEASKNRIVEVYNLLGEKILSHQANELEHQIDLQYYPSGIYFIKVIENNEQVYTQRIIKQ